MDNAKFDKAVEEYSAKLKGQVIPFEVAMARAVIYLSFLIQGYKITETELVAVIGLAIRAQLKVDELPPASGLPC